MRLKKILITFILIMSLSFILQINNVQAALQSNTNAPVSKNRNTWMTQIRAMESLNGTLGLSEEINADLTPTNNSKNGLDIHMQKNTEYGATILLAASSYGRSNSKILSGETTTGNETGVVFPYNSEWTAAQYTVKYGNSSYDGRYINLYPSNGQKSGDAYVETNGWHSSTSAYMGDKVWAKWSGSNDPGSYIYPGGIVRNTGTGVFSFNNCQTKHVKRYDVNKGYYWNPEKDVADITNTYRSRAVIVNGKDI